VTLSHLRYRSSVPAVFLAVSTNADPLKKYPASTSVLTPFLESNGVLNPTCWAANAFPENNNKKRIRFFMMPLFAFAPPLCANAITRMPAG
jgi:hypothetical protein